MLAIGIYDDGIQTLTTRYLDETLVRNQFKKKYGFDGTCRTGSSSCRMAETSMWSQLY